MRDKMTGSRLYLYIAGLIPVTWFALLIAPDLKDGLLYVLLNLGEVWKHPFDIQLCSDSLKSVAVCSLTYVLVLGIYLSNTRNYRHGEEHGSAQWGVARDVNRRYADKVLFNNKVLTMHVCISLNGRSHRRNLNVLVCGGSGSGKTRFYAKVNIMNANTSFVILDPKGRFVIG